MTPELENAGIAGAQEVREEDAFDVEAVRDWLAAQGHPLTGDVVVRQFGGGASNLTYSLRTEADDLILRRPPTGQKAKGAHDMAREYRIQAGLAGVFPLVPEMVALCEDESVIGSQFYVMKRIDGIIPRRDLPPGLSLTPEQARTLCTNALDVLIDLHRVDVDATPLAAMNKGEGYVRRQIEGWSTRYRNALTDDAPDGDAVMAWLADEQPADVGNCLIHNDFRFDNLVLDRDDPTRPIGVLDWEMATVGDPLMDLGGTLAYWVQDDDDEFFRQFRRQPTNLPGMLSRAEVVDYYCSEMAPHLGISSLTPEQWRFYEVYGLFRLAVIAQQIYYRYFHRQTTNEAYAIFGPATHYLLARCNAIIGSTAAGEA